MVDLGLTHVALPVSNLNDSIAFYTQYARMQVVHRRTVPATGFEVAWMSDHTRPFVVVLSERSQVDHPLVSPAHLGVACASREDVDRLCALARGEGRLINGPRDAGPPIGYVASIRDPDGHTLEVSFGQEVGLTVQQATSPRCAAFVRRQNLDQRAHAPADPFCAGPSRALPCRRPPSRPQHAAAAPLAWPPARQSAVQRNFRWGWTGVSAWGRVAPQECSGGAASERLT